MPPIEENFKNLSISGQRNENGEKKEKLKLGFKPLAEKQPPNRRGMRVGVVTNVRKLVLEPNRPIFKYSVNVKYVIKMPNGTEFPIDVSNSKKRDLEFEQDRMRCRKVYTVAVNRFEELSRGGPFFYDSQSTLFALTKLENERIAFHVSEGVSRRANFVRAEFELEKVDDSYEVTSDDIPKTVNRCPAKSEKSLLEALSTILSEGPKANEKVITVGECIHYLIKSEDAGIQSIGFQEGGLYSAVGATKSVKTLEGESGKPTLFMTAEMKTSLFHPDYVPLIEIMRSFRCFQPNMEHIHPNADKLCKALNGLSIVLNYGEYTGLLEDGAIKKIIGFSYSPFKQGFKKDGKTIYVGDYFREKYGIRLHFPELMTVMTKGPKGDRSYFPPELLLLCPSQKVTNERMVNNELSSLIKLSAAQPHIRQDTTERVVQGVGLNSTNLPDFIRIEEPTQVDGIVLDKPVIVFDGGRRANLNNPRSRYPTDFAPAGQYVYPKELWNWEIVFVQGEQIERLEIILMDEMRRNGMRVERPCLGFIVNKDIDAIFQNAQRKERQLLIFVTKKQYDYHDYLKCCEQKYDVLTQEIHLETAKKMFHQSQTTMNIVNKTNMKLGGLNYSVESVTFADPNLLVLGFSLGQIQSGFAEVEVLSVGFASNSLDHPQKFSGGYVYVKRSKDIFGPIIYQALWNAIVDAEYNREMKAENVVIYFNGVGEGQFSLINEVYVQECQNVFKDVRFKSPPKLTILASSKIHNERLYKSENGNITNLEPGTIVDTTIVSPVYNEFYHVGAVARQGTIKTAKYTVVYSSEPVDMQRLETMTNDLCYQHQIVYQPISLPSPLYIAAQSAERGCRILAENNGPIVKRGIVDIQRTNDEYGYGRKKLIHTRFNA